MSAYRFVDSDESIKAATTEELEKTLATYKKFLDKYDWSTYRQCTFSGDKAVGWNAAKEKIEEELKQRKDGVNEPLPRRLVIGYNPAEE